MKAIGCGVAGPVGASKALETVDVPRPEIGLRDLLVEVKGVSVKLADVKLRATVQPEGGAQADALRFIVNWPSKDNAEDFMADAAYARHLKARTNGSTSHHYLIEGKDDLV